MTIKATKYVTARAAARSDQFVYRDMHGQDVIVEGAEEEGGGKRVILLLTDGRNVTVDWNHKLRVVRSA